MLLAALISLLLSLLPAADSLSALDGKVAAYLGALRGQPVDVQRQEADFLIGSCQVDAVRDRVARQVYAWYAESPVMGEEAVAVHLVDAWFSPGKASFASDAELFAARLFADCNRSTLLGMKAPALLLEDPHGERFDALSGTGKWRVLYFYDTGCAVCKALTPALMRGLSGRTEPLEMIAVYTGDDAGAWTAYRRQQLQGTVTVRHFWDPSGESDFAMRYGVLQTPALFLIDPEGTIIGRRLDAEALLRLLEDAAAPLQYGGDAALDLYGRLLPAGESSLEDVKSVSGALLERSEASPRTRRQLLGDLLYYLSGQRAAGLKEGAAYVADSLILTRQGLWTAADSLTVLGLAGFVHEMAGRAAVGSTVPDLRVSGVLRGGCRDRSGTFRLGKLRREAYILFLTGSCNECKAEAAAVDRRIALARSRGLTAVQRRALRGVRYLLVDMDSVAGEEADALLDALDLRTLPLILHLDRGGRILERYVSLQ